MMQLVKNCFRALRYLWLLLGLSLALLLCVDAVLDAALPDPTLLSQFDPAARAPERSQADAFESADAAADYFKEFERARHTAWRSYVYFRRLPFDGQRIRVDQHGFRRTPTVPNPRFMVWLFGGSVAWGTGVSDDQTLAAELQKSLLEQSLPTQVFNFAESGWVSQQNFAMMSMALRCGAAPDAVVWLDGSNDIYAGFQNGVAGLPQNERNRVREFNLSRRLGQVFFAWASRLKGIQKLRTESGHALNVESLATSIVDRYARTIAQAKLLATAAGAQTLFVWQPGVWDKPTMSAHEQAAAHSMQRQHVALHHATLVELKKRFEADTESDFLDLSLVYQDVSAPRFFDYTHVNATGLRELSAAITPHLVARLVRGSERVSVEHTDCLELPEWPKPK
jgi:hypothetical protein